MAFTPEDGTGLPDANSYTSLEFADEFHALRGNAAWANATQPTREAALVKATDCLDQSYTWQGTPTTDTQALAWPRTDVPGVEDDAIPAKLQQATVQLALEALTKDLNPALEMGGAIKRKKVDVLEVEYQDGAKGGTTRPAITGLLRGLTASSGAIFNAKVVRV